MPHLDQHPPSSLRAGARRLARAVRRTVLARRRLLAALLTALAVASALRVLSPDVPAVTTVPVAARDLAPGTVLGPEDLGTVEVPRTLAPSRVVPSPVGRVLTGPLDAGEVVSETRLVGVGLAEQAPGRVALPLRLPDAGMVALLRVGDEVDLLATDVTAGGSAPAVLVATAVPVLALGGGQEAEGSPSLPGRLVVLSVAREEVAGVAAAAATAFVTFAWSAV